MAYELPHERPVFIADNKSICKLVDAAILVLARVHIDSINRLKDKWLGFGLSAALRSEDHPFWNAHGREIFEDISNLIRPHLPEFVYFGTHPDIPELVGLFKHGQENNIKHAMPSEARAILQRKPSEL